MKSLQNLDSKPSASDEIKVAYVEAKGKVYVIEGVTQSETGGGGTSAD